MVDLYGMNGWGSKAWDGCLQARAINVLHSICVSDYYHYYYQYYYYYCCCCCCCCCCCYISTDASSNYKACADWPILRSTSRSDYLITGRARGTREGGEEASSFSLLVRPRHLFFPFHKKAMIATMRGTTLEPLCGRQSTERTWRGRTRGAGGGGRR